MTYRYTLIIGTSDDFSSHEELIQAFEADNPNGLNMSVFRFEFPKIESEEDEGHQLAHIYGYGLAFQNDWCQDDTLSFFFREVK
jgi:hypothetical protein